LLQKLRLAGTVVDGFRYAILYRRGWGLHKEAACGLKQYRQIATKISVTSILQIQAGLVRKQLRTIKLIQAISRNLRKQVFFVPVSERCRSGNTGQQLLYLLQICRKLADILWQVRPGTNQAHLPEHNIDKLRQLIKLPFAEQPTKSIDAQVSACRDAWAPAVRGHGTKLYESEECAMSARSLLTIKYRSGRGALDQ